MKTRIKQLILIALAGGCLLSRPTPASGAEGLEADFATPPDAARPWVYWYFMDGNMTREGMTADLEAMKQAGIGGAIFLEVDIGVPRGTVKFMSPPWRELFEHAVHEAERLGLQIALGAGPGWCGTGGPWVKPELSMQHLVSSQVNVTGPRRFQTLLPQPAPRKPFFGEGTLTPELAKQWREFYRDEAVVAFPTPSGTLRLKDADEKALYFRAPYSSQPGVKPFLPAPANFPATPAGESITASAVMDLTGKLAPDGRLEWDVPAGNWTIMRFGRTITGQTTRPAPLPGLGFESDKFDTRALDAHFDAFAGKLLREMGPRHTPGRGLTTLHFDSWEMSSQNWSEQFRNEFAKRRGYDPLRYLPAMSGMVVDSIEVSERFLWDLRQTSQELVVENHAMHLKKLAHKNDLQLSIEPYDLNPTSDLTLGGVADVPMCEFWWQGFETSYSVLEAASIGHTRGRPIVAAESFTSEPGEDWQGHPGALKNHGDWAFGAGVNRIVFHRYQHQPWLDRRPGMRMGPYGVHWERTQTWWDQSLAYHQYLARCQYLLRKGLPVADILYLAAEGAPHVFRPPASALQHTPPDRKGYTFDGCAPDNLIANASVRGGRITFPDGMSYAVLVLPKFDTMTPGLLAKIKQLVRHGATIVGAPPSKSPSLAGYPQCDSEVQSLAREIWGAQSAPSPERPRQLGKGRVFLDTEPASTTAAPAVYPAYETVATILKGDGLAPDFSSDAPLRSIHRRDGKTHLYFVANTTAKALRTECQFRVTGLQPELWDPLTGKCRTLPQFTSGQNLTTIPMEFAANQSFFVLFRQRAARTTATASNFPKLTPALPLEGKWDVHFDPAWGGPESIIFPDLADWTKRPEPGIRNYSGKAIYRKQFRAPEDLTRSTLRLDLGSVDVIASITLNGRPLGTVWCPPWQVDVPANLLKPEGNHLEIEVANLWPNRLIGDSALPVEQRRTWTTSNPFKPESPLMPSGLHGPVSFLSVEGGVNNGGNATPAPGRR